MIVNKYGNGGGGSGSGSTDLTNYWNSAVTEQHIESAATEVYASAVSYTDAALAEKADAKTIIDFDRTTQADRAAIYAELKALYDGGSGATINKTYDFFKTVGFKQGLKIDYYTISGDTAFFGKVVSPDNITEQVVYGQVLAIDSAGNVTVATNTVGGVDLSGYYTSAQTDEAIAQAVSGLATEQYVQDALSGVNMDNYWTSAQTEEKIASAVTPVAEHLAEVEQVTSSGYNELHTQVLELSARTVDLTGYYTSAQTDQKISAAIAPMYTSAQTENAITSKNYVVSGQVKTQIEAYNYVTSADVETQILSKNYTTSAETKAYVDSAVTGVQDQIDTMDEVIAEALVDLDGRVDAISAATQNMVISTDVRQIVKLTQAAYDQLATKDPDTFYIIVNSN